MSAKISSSRSRNSRKNTLGSNGDAYILAERHAFRRQNGLQPQVKRNIEVHSVVGTRHMNRASWLAVLLIILWSATLSAEQRYQASGVVLRVDRVHQTMTVSC